MPPKKEKLPPCPNCKEAISLAEKCIGDKGEMKKERDEALSKIEEMQKKFKDILNKHIDGTHKEKEKATKEFEFKIKVLKQCVNAKNTNMYELQQESLLNSALQEEYSRSLLYTLFKYRRDFKAIPDLVGNYLLIRNDLTFATEKFKAAEHLLSTKLFFFVALFTYYYCLAQTRLKLWSQAAISSQRMKLLPATTDASTQCEIKAATLDVGIQACVATADISIQSCASMSDATTQYNFKPKSSDFEMQYEFTTNTVDTGVQACADMFDVATQHELKTNTVEIGVQASETQVFSAELVQELNAKMRILKKENKEAMKTIFHLREEIEQFSKTRSQIQSLLNVNFTMKANAEPQPFKEYKPDDPGDVLMNRGTNYTNSQLSEDKEEKPKDPSDFPMNQGTNYINSQKTGNKVQKPKDPGDFLMNQGTNYTNSQRSEDKEEKPEDPGDIPMNQGTNYLNSQQTGDKVQKPKDPGDFLVNQGTNYINSQQIEDSRREQKEEKQKEVNARFVQQDEQINSLKEDFVKYTERTEQLVQKTFFNTNQLVMQIQQDVRLKEHPNLDFMEVLDFHAQIQAVKKCVEDFSEIEKTLEERYMKAAQRDAERIKTILEDSESIYKKNRQEKVELALVSNTLKTNVKLQAESPNKPNSRKAVKLTNTFRLANHSRETRASEPILIVVKPNEERSLWEKELKNSIYYQNLSKWSQKDYLSVTEFKPYSDKMDLDEWQFQKNMNWRLNYRNAPRQSYLK